MDFEKCCSSLRIASHKLSVQNAENKNKALLIVAEELDKNRSEIISANNLDIEKARKNGTKESLIDRLMLNDDRINGII